MRHSSEPWGLKQLSVFQKLSWQKLIWCLLKCFALFLKKKKVPRFTWIWKLQKKIVGAAVETIMMWECTTSACLGLWHVVGVYSCDKESDEMAPYKQRNISKILLIWQCSTETAIALLGCCKLWDA